MEILAAVLAALAGQALLLATLAWLSKGLFSQLLAKDLERFKAALASESAIAMERLRHDLQLRALERQITFTKLHERRAEVLAKLYEKLVELNSAAETFASSSVPDGSDEKKRHYIAALNALTDLWKFFQRNEIYLPEGLGSAIGDYVNRLHSEVVGLSVYTRHSDDKLPESAMQTKYQAWSRVNKYLNGEMPAALGAIAKEFRTLLGAEDQVNHFTHSPVSGDPEPASHVDR